jgi:two-component system cell cycle sensor histidine kinase/response regulator CckA
MPSSHLDLNTFVREADERPRLSPGAILLVDDEKAILDIAARLLASIGFDVIQARRGEEALRLYSEHQLRIRLALVDLSMPRISGEAILRELRKLSTDLPLVLMSGYPPSDVLARLEEVKLSGFLQKPFRLPSLLELLRRLEIVDE